MAWIYLILAGVCEIGWPLGFKLSQTTSYKITWVIIAIVSMGVSGYLLWLAQRDIPMGTAYAVWTGIGAVGAFVCGIMFFKDSASLFRMMSVMLIIIGIIGLKLSSR